MGVVTRSPYSQPTRCHDLHPSDNGLLRQPLGTRDFVTPGAAGCTGSAAAGTWNATRIASRSDGLEINGDDAVIVRVVEIDTHRGDLHIGSQRAYGWNVLSEHCAVLSGSGGGVIVTRAA